LSPNSSLFRIQVISKGDLEMSLFSVDNGIVIGSFDNDSNENEDEHKGLGR